MEVCPLSDEQHPLVRNGGYDRWFWIDWVEKRVRVSRKLCRKCGVSFSLLPEDALAHWQYPRDFVEAWLWAALQGTSCRSRDFLVAEGVPLPEPDPDESWSDQQDGSGVRPCHQLLARWTREFAVRAARLTPTLTALCVLLELDLKEVAASISELRVTRPRLSPLPVALGLMQVLRRALAPDLDFDLRACLPQLLVCLARRQLPPSHGVLRASGGRLLYDSLIT